MQHRSSAAPAPRYPATPRRAIRTGGLLVALLAAMPLAAPAASLIEYGVSAVSQDGVLSPDAGSFQVPVSSVFFDTATSGGAQASAGYNAGVTRVSAAATWVAGAINQTSANARVLILDTFTLSAPLGSTAFGANLSFSVGLSGSLAAVNGAALWSAYGELSSLAYRDPNLGTVQPRIIVDADGRRDATTGDMGTALPVTLNSATSAPGTTTFFPYNVPIDLRWIVQAVIDSADAGGSGRAGSASANLTDTAVWLGITARDNQGAIIEGLRITSPSGLNWLEPATVVPLPATAWLLATGFVGIFARRQLARRKRAGRTR